MSACGKKLLFIINPKAGGTSKEGLRERIEQKCKAAGVRAIFAEKKKGFGSDAVRSLVEKEKPDACIACGGDGTVNLVGIVLLGTSMPLGIIPLGSSNALSKNLAIPQDVDGSLEVIIDFQTRSIDTLSVNDLPCIHICDVGLNARVIKRFKGSKTRGMITYAWLLLRVLFRIRQFAYQIQTADDELRGNAFNITFTNTRMYGTYAAINPKGHMDDGKFEIAILRPYPYYALFGLFFRLYRHTIHRSRYTIFLRTKEAWMRNLHCEPVHIDGEPISTPSELHVRIQPMSLTVIVPAEKATSQVNKEHGSTLAS